jgi:hypothetical protein
MTSDEASSVATSVKKDDPPNQQNDHHGACQYHHDLISTGFRILRLLVRHSLSSTSRALAA